ncbi:MAG: NAD-glutamate dehydrogenase [Tepidamorphaceae bacterium]
MKSLLGLSADTATPQQVMKAILSAKADLLWFGGIGTYVRTPDETDGLRSAIAPTTRSASPQTTCGSKPSARAANLGMTQLG